jgi:hypothetical protein
MQPPAQSSFYSWNLVAHAPIALFFLLGSLFVDKRPLSKDSLLANERAVKAGFPRVVVGFMVSYQHLTTCTHLLATMYLAARLAGLSGLAAAAQAMLLPAASIVGIGWTVLFNWSPSPALKPPWTMLPRAEFPKGARGLEVADLCTRRPSLTPFMGMFIMLQMMHVAIPLLPWVDIYLYASPPTLAFGTEVALALGYTFAYLGWSLGVCWRARGKPPYPVLEAVYKEGNAPLFYGIFIAGGILISAAGYHARGGVLFPR